METSSESQQTKKYETFRMVKRIRQAYNQEQNFTNKDLKNQEQNNFKDSDEPLQQKKRRAFHLLI